MTFECFAMLRFHSDGKFCRENLTLVLKGGREITPSEVGTEITIRLLVSNSVVGFYFTFDDKFHPGARVYYCVGWEIYTVD